MDWIERFATFMNVCLIFLGVLFVALAVLSPLVLSSEQARQEEEREREGYRQARADIRRKEREGNDGA